ncbi:uncharacterized protein CMU_041890 [Cryptosporidium muris RN66]|uniref:Nucleoporin Nup133/Nup155-like N-terminal domain-containing protein n=1 Tax=Cryptosporidium muris (strain RN66) TaxID=441375 RepID=B6AA75_CRYMR|nr:uncharacterized protein CMU_041890 [Cryptosporidium muris RN66]EEA05116.1 hypothetical protein, conserved [Cryptosporidium muris RN66]|eukprot:XP_002139465.1 hypothetical protein [Cryptosporidium muris RN66]
MFDIRTQKPISDEKSGAGSGISIHLRRCDLIESSINGCLQQDEEWSEIEHYLKGQSLMNEYEYRPEIFDLKQLKIFPRKVSEMITLNMEHTVKPDSSISRPWGAIGSSSIFYVYYSNELLFWNWSKGDVAYSIQSEEFYNEVSGEKSIITALGYVESEDGIVKCLVSTLDYIIMLKMTKKSTGGYIIDRINDSLIHLYEYNAKITSIVGHNASDRLFLGCSNNGSIFEFALLSQEVSWKYRNVRKLIRSESNTESISMTRLICISSNGILNWIPNSLKRFLTKVNSVKIYGMFIDEYRGLLYVLHGNSDIDVYAIPPTPVTINYLDDISYLSVTNLDSYQKPPVIHLFTLSNTKLSAEICKKLESTSKSNLNKNKSVPVVGNNSNNMNIQGSNFSVSLNIKSIHPISPLESDSAIVMLVNDKGDRFYMEASFDTQGSSLVGHNSKSLQNSELVQYMQPKSLKVKNIKASPTTLEDKPVYFSVYSSGVFIQMTRSSDNMDNTESEITRPTEKKHYIGNLSPNSLRHQFSERDFIPSTFMDDHSNYNRVSTDKTSTNYLKAIKSHITACCKDVTVLAQKQAPSYPNPTNIKSSLCEWYCSFSQVDLGYVLFAYEKPVLKDYWRLFYNLWNTPNPFNPNSISSNKAFVRPKISKENFSVIYSAPGFGAKTSGSLFYHLWKYLFDTNGANSINNKPDFSPLNEFTKSLLSTNTLGLNTCSTDLAPIKENSSSNITGFVIPRYPPSGLCDLSLDQVAQNRQWIVITTTGIFLLEKRRMIDIVTLMTLEPQNYSYMIDIFDNSPLTSQDPSLQLSGYSINFITKLLGIFAHTVTFEQFFAVLWQGIISLTAKGTLNSEVFEKLSNGRILDKFNLDTHKDAISIFPRMEYISNTEFPHIVLIQIWLTLLSDSSIQNRPDSSCLISINNLNEWFVVTPRSKGLLLLVSRILRCIWSIPLFQQEITDSGAVQNKTSTTPLLEYVLTAAGKRRRSTENVFVDNSYTKDNNKYSSASILECNSEKGKSIILEDFYKPEASEWFEILSLEDINLTQKFETGVFSVNSENELNLEQHILKIQPTLTKAQIKHLQSNISPIITLLDMLLPIWFPNYKTEVQSMQKCTLNSNHTDEESRISSSTSPVTELQLFIELSYFLCKVLEVLAVISLVIDKNPNGIKYTICSREQDSSRTLYYPITLLKKSLLNITLESLANNPKHQFLYRLFLRYDLIPSDDTLRNLPFKDTSYILPISIIKVEYIVALLRKRVRECRLDNLTGGRKIVKVKNVDNSDEFEMQNIFNTLYENVQNVPLNVTIPLLYELKEYQAIMTLIYNQTDHIYKTGTYPMWITNGSYIQVNTPKSLDNYKIYTSNSSGFFNDFLQMILNEIISIGAPSSLQTNSIASYHVILSQIDTKKEKSLLESCKKNELGHLFAMSMYTLEFHCVLWIYQSYYHILVRIFEKYVSEIDSVMPEILQIFDGNTNDLLETEQLPLEYIKTHLTHTNSNALNESKSKISSIKEKLLFVKQEIIELITISLKYSRDNAKLGRSSNHMLMSSNNSSNSTKLPKFNEWFHYFLFSLLSYNENCLIKTFEEELGVNKKKIKDISPIKSWLISNLCISVFDFSEASPYIKNWLEYFQNAEITNSSMKNIINNRLPDLLSNDDVNNHGYLLFHAKQYILAGNYFIEKAKKSWNRRTLNLDYNISPHPNQASHMKSSVLIPKSISVDSPIYKSLCGTLNLRWNNFKKLILSSTSIQESWRIKQIFVIFEDIYQQLISIQQEPTLLQRKAYLLQAQTCIQKDRNDKENKSLLQNIWNNIQTIDIQWELVISFIELCVHYILIAMQQNVDIIPLVHYLFGGLATVQNLNNTQIDSSILKSEISANISEEGIDILKCTIYGIYSLQCMVHSEETLFQLMDEFHKATGYSCITEIRWVTNKLGTILDLYYIDNKISYMCEFRTKQAIYFDSPILFELDIIHLLNLYEKIQLDNKTENCIQIETICLELHLFSTIYYNQYKQNDLVDIYSADNISEVKCRVLWWTWPIKFITFHLSNKVLCNRLFPLYSGQSNKFSTLSNFINNSQRAEICEIIKSNIHLAAT